jgi:hypothetical protein
VVLKKFEEKRKYDQGGISFRAKKGKLVDLDKLHESIWATRLSVGTRSGAVSLEVTVVGEAVLEGEQTIIKVAGSKARFVLRKHVVKVKDFARGANLGKGHKDVFEDLLAALKAGRQVNSVTGYVEGWSGRWTGMLRKRQPKPRRILVTSFKATAKREVESRTERKTK